MADDPTDAQIAAALKRVTDFRAVVAGQLGDDLDLLLSIARAQRLIRVKDRGAAAG